jgi:hypothetical protein
MAEDLKHVFDNFDENSTTKNAKNKLQSLMNKWKERYPNLKNHCGEDKQI